jgi:hypothetical protein
VGGLAGREGNTPGLPRRFAPRNDGVGVLPGWLRLFAMTIRGVGYVPSQWRPIPRHREGHPNIRHREGRQARGDPGQVGGLAGREGNTPGLPRRFAPRNDGVGVLPGWLRLFAMTIRGVGYVSSQWRPIPRHREGHPNICHREGRQARGGPGQVGGLAGRGGKPLDCRVASLLAMTAWGYCRVGFASSQ